MAPSLHRGDPASPAGSSRLWLSVVRPNAAGIRQDRHSTTNPQRDHATALRGGSSYAVESRPARNDGCHADTSRGQPGLAQVEPLLEEAADPLAGQADLVALGPLDAEDPDCLVHAPVAAAITLGLAQGP